MSCVLLGCGHGVSDNARRSDPPPAPPPLPVDIRINEVVSNNQGVWLDEAGETDDYIELINASPETRHLGDYVLEDSSRVVQLPRVELEPGQVVLLWADDNTAQGASHIGMRISASGERLTLSRSDGTVVDQVKVPALAEHHAYVRMPDGIGSFSDCGWATPARQNGNDCGPPPLPDMPDETAWAPFQWPSPWPAAPAPLRLTELALRPAEFIEVLNTSGADVDLSRYSLRVAPHRVGVAWPDANTGVELTWPQATLAVGQRVVVAIADTDLIGIAATPNFEGVVSIFSRPDAAEVDRKDFSYFPSGASLARVPDPNGAFQYCTQASRGLANDPCKLLASRPVGDHLCDLATPNDFAALSSGRGQVGAAAVEFIDDMDSGDVITFLSASDWDIHYSFVREAIEGRPRLNRCVDQERSAYNTGWYAFSVDQYWRTEGRRYLLGTLVNYAGSNLHTVEFTPGDIITAEQMLHAFYAVLRHVNNPTEWALRAQDTGLVWAPDLTSSNNGSTTYPSQIDRIRAIDGKLPIVDNNAPFRGETFQPLVPTVGYGTLRYVTSEEMNSAELGPRDIVVTNQVPLNIPLIAGLITEAFQTPLAHVNVLSRGRGTPNMALKDARKDPRLMPWLGKLVRLEVRASDFTVQAADPVEALAFWESRRPQGTAAIPRLDTSVREPQDLAQRSIADIPTIGAKAAQLAELGRSPLCGASGGGTAVTRVPQNSFAIPVVHSLEHFEKCGAATRLANLLRSAELRADTAKRGSELAKIRADILNFPVDVELLSQVRSRIAANWSGQRVRLRSSSNTEDLPSFNGAGLYTSEGIDAAGTESELADAIRNVWASLWELRAYDERDYYNVDQTSVAMAVLVQEAFPSEKANGVAISRNVLQPSDGDYYYINAQLGEALVTNPAPGIASDQYKYSLSRTPHIERVSFSSFSKQIPILSEEESERLACSLEKIHKHFRPLLDPNSTNSWFAMDIEFKIVGEDRQLVIKQARPYSFGQEAPTGWCDL